MPLPDRALVDGKKRTRVMFAAKDELLIGLLASEAIVDSSGYDNLSAEKVEELKKEQQVLSSRLVPLSKKLTLETKIRDAATSLSRAKASYKNVSKQLSEQLENANRKVDLAQQELWRVSDKAAKVNGKLLEHNSGVLSYTERSTVSGEPTQGIPRVREWAHHPVSGRRGQGRFRSPFDMGHPSFHRSSRTESANAVASPTTASPANKGGASLSEMDVRSLKRATTPRLQT
ncbi:Up-regulated during septation-domain-containing protein [Fomes fomentarius]|nr:Up-regulated during septation-domain-containing protein [Fomes fomentarius]KAI0774611.1 Up-regulated during septation-domain-containing protein [Fomes fomentarius]